MPVASYRLLPTFQFPITPLALFDPSLTKEPFADPETDPRSFGRLPKRPPSKCLPESWPGALISPENVRPPAKFFWSNLLIVRSPLRCAKSQLIAKSPLAT